MSMRGIDVGIDIAGGTDEEVWSRWPARGRLPRLDLDAWRGRRVTVLAAHPDDEVLGIGGMLALLAERGDVSLTFVWATCGEASHPGSRAAAVADLARLRRAEAAAALGELRVHDADAIWLGLPDGGLEKQYDALARAVKALHRPGDVLLAPFSGDGHPDHEACGRAAAAAGFDVVEYPVWAWHWSQPGDGRVPWGRARVVPLPVDVVERKAAAIASFRTQVQSLGPDPADGPVLPPRVLDHFRRDYEVVLV
jgi:LmbE family N-acetylglucosaminyl deacetylase